MKAMQQLIKIPEVAATMRDLSKEMMKVILIYPAIKNNSIKNLYICRLVLLRKC